MADLEVLIRKLNEFDKELRQQMPVIVREMCGVALSFKITQLRRNRGLFSNAKYSDHPGVPAYLYKGKNGDYPRALNAAGRAYINRQIKEGKRYNAKKGETTGGSRFSPFTKAGFVNWKGLRAAQGLQTSKVDLTYTGRMFQNIGIIEIINNGFECEGIVGGIDKETKDKLKWNRARYGDFLRFTGLSYKLARDKAIDRIESLFNRIVLN